MKLTRGLAVASLLAALPGWALAADIDGSTLSVLWGVPFAGILLSIALGPLLNLHWWEHNQAKVSLFWAAAFFLPFTFLFGFSQALYASLHMYIIDYIFIKSISAISNRRISF